MTTNRKTNKLSTVSQVAKALRKHKNFLLAAHIRPEGDSIGSLLALKYLLEKLGKEPWIVSPDPFPKRLDIMPQKGWHTLEDMKQLAKQPRFDACIVVDCPNMHRMGKLNEWIGPETEIINIDHHVSNIKFGDYNLVNDRASACGEIIYDLYKELRVSITKEAALPIYVSISTDTGSFRYSHTSAKTHRIIAELIQSGLDSESINERLYERSSCHRVSLLSEILRKINVEFDGRVVWAVITGKMMDKSGTVFEDTEGFVDYLRAVDGAEVSFMMIETGRNKYQVSFRAKGRNDVNRIAECLDGGGHRKSAGCTIEGSLAESSKQILSVIRKYLRKPTFSRPVR